MPVHRVAELLADDGRRIHRGDDLFAIVAARREQERVDERIVFAQQRQLRVEKLPVLFVGHTAFESLQRSFGAGAESFDVLLDFLRLAGVGIEGMLHDAQPQVEDGTQRVVERDDAGHRIFVGVVRG